MKYFYKAIWIVVGVSIISLFFYTKGDPQFTLFWSTLFWSTVSIVGAIAILEAFDKQLLGILKTAFLFFFLGDFRDPKTKTAHYYFQKRIRFLTDYKSGSKWMMMKVKWEKKLLEYILEESGWYRAKASGKNNNKITWKFRKDGSKYKIRGKI